jgi:hypothetical protein
MSTKDDCVVLLDDPDGLISALKEEDLDVVASIADSVAEVIEASPWPDLSPEAYFIWMYSVIPFAEC